MQVMYIVLTLAVIGFIVLVLKRANKVEVLTTSSSSINNITTAPSDTLIQNKAPVVDVQQTNKNLS